MAHVRMRDALQLPEGTRWETRKYPVEVEPEEYLSLACKHVQGAVVLGSDVLVWVRDTPRVRFIG